MATATPPSPPRHRDAQRGVADSAASRRLDQGAITLSGLCLVHCLAFPVIIALIPAMAAFLPNQWWVHPLILMAAAPLAAVAFWRGWQRHRDQRPGLLGAAGLLALAAGVASAEGGVAETALTVAGGLLLASAHALNWRLDHARHATVRGRPH